MTPEQIAEELLPDGSNFDSRLHPLDLAGKRRRIADALRAAAVDDAMRAEAKKQIDDILSSLRWGRVHVVERETLSRDLVQQLIDNPDFRRELDRLAFLLGLSATERAFLQSYEECPQDRTTWLVFADWLEQQNKPAEALRFRTMFPQPGQVAVLTIPRPDSDALYQLNAKMTEAFYKQFGCFTIGLVEGQTLEMLDEDMMREHGWVKADRLASHIHEMDKVRRALTEE